MIAQRDKTPMERDYPTICEWARHGTVMTHALKSELLRALAWTMEDEPIDLGKNGLHDIAPHADLTDPAMTPLRRHIAERRAKTRAAIARGLEKCFLGADVTPAVDAVLASLEKMWRDDETFS